MATLLIKSIKKIHQLSSQCNEEYPNYHMHQSYRKVHSLREELNAAGTIGPGTVFAFFRAPCLMLVNLLN